MEQLKKLCVSTLALLAWANFSIEFIKNLNFEYFKIHFKMYILNIYKK